MSGATRLCYSTALHYMLAKLSMGPSLRVIKGEDIQSTNQGGIPFLFTSRFPPLPPLLYTACYTVRTLLNSLNSMTFHDPLHDLFNFSKTLGLVVIFKIFQNFP